ncbi:MAG: hypothetical protein ACOCZE_09060 [Planctomycetota bacterium]
MRIRRLMILMLLPLAGCLEQSAEISPGKGNPLGVVSNEYFGLSVKQAGRDVPIRNRTVELRRGGFDLIFAFPVPSGVFVNASARPDFGREALAGADLAGQSPLVGLDEPNPAVLRITDRKWQYWYYLGPGISKFTDVREVQPGQGQRITWVCRKGILGYRVGSDRPVDLRSYPYDDLYLVIIKADWNAGHTQRVEQAREVLHIRFR